MTEHASIGTPAVLRARVVAVVLLMLGAAQPVFGSSVLFAVFAVVVAVAAGIWIRGDDVPETKDAAVLVVLVYAVGLIPGVGLWPAGPAIALLVTALVSWRTGRLTRWREWFRVGRIDGVAWVTIVAVGVVSVAVLVVWQSLFDGQLPSTYRQLTESVSPSMAIVGALGFTIVNGAIEDSIFFGVLLTPLLRHLPSGLAVVMTAVTFGLAHFNGVPSGLVGIVLAATWALMLGYLRTRTGGMLATYLAHVVADATIVAVLIPPLLAA
jgi:membrane protease YdiL (CAAX protease family)